MRPRAVCGRLGATLTAIVLATGCTAASTASSVPTVDISMTMVCGFSRPTMTTAADITQSRDVAMTCTANGTDARVTGTQTGLLSVDEHPDGSAELWHSYRLAGADGSWVGASSGLIAAGYTTHRIHVHATGAGANAGLVLELDVVGDGSGTYTASGTIGPER